jgi:exosome complex component RRP43
MTDATATAAGGLAGEMEVEAYRRLFPLAFLERHLRESVRPDARRLGEARATTVALGAVSSAHGSALVRLGDTVRPPSSHFSSATLSQFPLPC